MKNVTHQKVIAFLSIAILIAFPLHVAQLYAQQPAVQDEIPSDLSLDLHLAQQNPAPDQQQILQSETRQAEVVSDTGDTFTTTPQDTIVPEVKTEPKQDAQNPDMTTSEQVVTIPVVVPADQNGTPIPTDQPANQPTVTSSDSLTGVPTPGLVPGTDVTQPDDNSAPKDNSTNPNLAAPTQADDSSITPTMQNAAPTSDQNIPLESQPQVAPTSDQSTPSQPSDNSNQGSSDNVNQGSSQDSATSQDQSSQDQSGSSDSSNDSSVQGASVGPNPIMVFFQNIQNFGKKFIKKLFR